MSERAPWRTGRKLGRTLYTRKYSDAPSDDDHFVGIMDTRELAEQVADAVNAVKRIRQIHAPVHGGPDNAPTCRACRTSAWPCPTIRAIDGSDDE